MTVGAFFAILLAVFMSGGWMLCIYLINQFAGNPYWVAVQQLFWPVGIPALILLLGGIQAQISFWLKKKRGVAPNELPNTVPLEIYLLLPGFLLVVVSIGWLIFLFTNYSWFGATRRVQTPCLLMAASVIFFLVYGVIQKKRR